MWFNSNDLVELKSSVPMFNETLPSIYRGLVNRPSAYADLDFSIERTTEAIAIFSAIITDMKPYTYRFFPVQKTGGDKKVEKAIEFTDKHRFADNYSYALWDWISYGDGYLWMGLPDMDLMKTAFNSGLARAKAIWKITHKVGLQHDIDFLEYKAHDEDAIKSLKHVPANTMNIDHDKKQITQFRQIVGVDELKWPVEHIIHNKLITMKGKVYGFSPSISALTEINTLGYLKDYAGTFFKNGGFPDWMFVLPKEIAGSDNHRKLIQMLQKYKNPQNKHGNLVFTGEVEPHQLSKFDKDMEFRQLAIYLTGVLALAFNMPLSRVATIIGSVVKISAGSDDLANEGYWNKIDEMQSSWERILNSQLFIPFFGVKIRFDRGYKQNEVREVQRAVQAGESVAKINTLLSEHEKQVSLTYIKSMFYLEDHDLKEGAIKDPVTLGTGNPMSNDKINRGPGREGLSNEKKKQVLKKQKTDSELKALEVEAKSLDDKLNTLKVKKTVESIKRKNKLIKEIEKDVS